MGRNRLRGTVKLTLREQAGAAEVTSPFESRGARDGVPSEERARPELSVMASLQQLASDAEEILDESMRG